MEKVIQADVVVIGSGVAGGLVANELAKQGKQVLILEAGPMLTRGGIVDNFRQQADKSDNSAPYPSTPYAPHPEKGNNYLIQKGSHPYDVQYIRAVGGTTWHWAASAWRFLPNDFKIKSLYGVGLDWPIEYQDLEPWYFKAEVELGVWGPNDVDLGSPRTNPYPMDPLPLSWNEQRVKDKVNANYKAYQVVTEPAARNSKRYDNRPTCCGNNNCMPICPIGAMYNGITHVEKAVSAGAILRPESVVYKLDVDDKNTITAALFKDPQGNEYRAEAKYFVLAANGIESPKLLLMSTSDKNPNGVANSSDMVGRNLMDHPGTGISFQADEMLWPGRGPQEMTSLIGFRDGKFRSQYASKKIHLSNTSRVDEVTKALVADPQHITGASLEAQIVERSGRFVRIDSFHEILPRPENRIVPSKTERDQLGIPKPEFTYAIDDYVKKSAAHTKEVYSNIAKLFNGKDIQYFDDFANNNHITGTMIMGSDPKTSVVDKDCRTHDHGNLFVASSGVMTTVGSVNCTLTIAALSLRIADQLMKEL